MKEISIKWSTEDVLMEAEILGIKLTEEEADNVLDDLEYGHDSSLGINWDVIKSYIYQFDNERKDEKHRVLMKYPFSEGDDYWTIDKHKVIWSCWDNVSEQLHDLNPQKVYFATEQLALDFLNYLNKQNEK